MASNIQFLRSTVESLRPRPHTLSLGTPMINVNDVDPGLFFRSKEGNLLKIGPVHVGDFPPNNTPPGGTFQGHCVGEQWLNTSDLLHPKLLTWNGVEWEEHRNPALVYVQENAPSSPYLVNGVLWFKMSTRELWLYHDGVWVDIQRRPYGNNTQVQYNKNNEFHAHANFTYDDALNQLTVGSILFPGGHVYSGPVGGNYDVQFKLNKDFSGTSDFQFNPTNKKLTVLGPCVLGDETVSSPNTIALNGTTNANGNMSIGINALSTLVVNSTSTFENDVTFGSDLSGNVTVRCPATFTNNVDIGGDPNDILTINSVVLTDNAIQVGSNANYEVTVKSNINVVNDCRLENSATLTQWYLERLSNTEITLPQVGHVLVHGPGNKWYNEAPGAGPYGNVVEEAPLDGQKYVRQNGAWVVA